MDVSLDCVAIAQRLRDRAARVCGHVESLIRRQQASTEDAGEVQ